MYGILYYKRSKMLYSQRIIEKQIFAFVDQLRQQLCTDWEYENIPFFAQTPSNFPPQITSKLSFVMFTFTHLTRAREKSFVCSEKLYNDVCKQAPTHNHTQTYHIVLLPLQSVFPLDFPTRVFFVYSFVFFFR